jgi:deoxyribonuclease-4
MGFKRMDLLTHPPHLWPYDADKSVRIALRQLLRAEGMAVDSLNLPSTDHNLCSVTQEMRDYTVLTLAAMIDLCGDLGAPYLVVVPGRQLGFSPPSRAESEAWLCDGLERLIPKAERHGVRILLENHHLSPLPLTADLVVLLERIGSRRLGIAYDIANGIFSGEELAGAIRNAAPWLGQVHLSDANATRWDQAPLGAGTVDFTTLPALLLRAGFGGTSIVEIVSAQPDQDLPAGRAPNIA